VLIGDLPVTLKRLCEYLLLILACRVYSSAYAVDKIVVDYGGVSGFQGASWVAKDLKIFDKYGLDADVIMITGGARSVATLLSGSSQFGTGSATAPLLATARGSDIKVIAASYNKFPYAFIAKPDIRSPKELRGKKISILNYGGSNDLALQLALREWGIKQQEVTVISAAMLRPGWPASWRARLMQPYSLRHNSPRPCNRAFGCWQTWER
jgi:ABC-type nitrate/sulfonate/bicarbonate transport system substrate-binding protein